MNCARAQRWIHQSLDGELPPPRRKALHEHLGACPACERCHRQLTVLRRATSRLATLSAGPEPAIRPLASVSPRINRWALVGSLAAAIGLGAGIWRLAATLKPEPGTTARAPDLPRPSTAAAIAAAPSVRVEFSPESDVIAVQRPTRSANVTIMWVYPALNTAQAAPGSAETDNASFRGADL